MIERRRQGGSRAEAAPLQCFRTGEGWFADRIEERFQARRRRRHHVTRLGLGGSGTTVFRSRSPLPVRRASSHARQVDVEAAIKCPGWRLQVEVVDSLGESGRRGCPGGVLVVLLG